VDYDRPQDHWDEMFTPMEHCSVERAIGSTKQKESYHGVSINVMIYGYLWDLQWDITNKTISG
jgi:hypothetical protein